MTGILTLTVAAVGAYSNPLASQYSANGTPLKNTAVVPISTEGSSQTKMGNLGLTGTFFARGNAVFKDHVRISGPLYGGSESAQVGSRKVQVGTPGEVAPTSVFVHNDVRTIGKLQTEATQVLAGGETRPVCSDIDGFVVLCDTLVIDVCTNIDGPQDVVPSGMTEAGGVCTTPSTPITPILGSSSSLTTTQAYAAIGGSTVMNYLFNSNYYPDSELTLITGNSESQEIFLMGQAVCKGVGPDRSPYAVTLSGLSFTSRPYGTNYPTKPFPSINDIIYDTGTNPFNG